MLPELPIARLRAEGQVLEVEELALSRRDAQLLLRGVRPELDAADAAELWERTEGGQPACISQGSSYATGRDIAGRCPRSPVRTGSWRTTSASSTSRGSIKPTSAS